MLTEISAPHCRRCAEPPMDRNGLCIEHAAAMIRSTLSGASAEVRAAWLRTWSKRNPATRKVAAEMEAGQ